METHKQATLVVGTSPSESLSLLDIVGASRARDAGSFRHAKLPHLSTRRLAGAMPTWPVPRLAVFRGSAALMMMGVLDFQVLRPKVKSHKVTPLNYPATRTVERERRSRRDRCVCSIRSRLLPLPDFVGGMLVAFLFLLVFTTVCLVLVEEVRSDTLTGEKPLRRP